MMGNGPRWRVRLPPRRQGRADPASLRLRGLRPLRCASGISDFAPEPDLRGAADDREGGEHGAQKKAVIEYIRMNKYMTKITGNRFPQGTGALFFMVQ